MINTMSDKRPKTARVSSSKGALPKEDVATVKELKPVREIKPINEVVEKKIHNYLQKNFKNVGDIERQLWKNNIMWTPR